MAILNENQEVTRKVLNKYIGIWQKRVQEGRENKKIISAPKSGNLDLAIGEKNKYLFSVIYPGEDLVVGKIALPPGKYSDPEVHEGDEIINVLKGTLIVTVFSEEENTNPDEVMRSCYKIEKGEKMFIPENYKHTYKNLGDENVEAIVAVSPKI